MTNDALNKAYTERMIVVAIFAKTSGFKYGIGLDDQEDWDIEWRNVIYIDTPYGQLSWHIAPHDMHIFQDFPKYEGKWDGTFNGKDADFVKSIPHRAALAPVDVEEELNFLDKMISAPYATYTSISREQLKKLRQALAASGYFGVPVALSEEIIPIKKLIADMDKVSHFYDKSSDDNDKNGLSAFMFLQQNKRQIAHWLRCYDALIAARGCFVVPAQVSPEFVRAWDEGRLMWRNDLTGELEPLPAAPKKEGA